ncbi:MAG: hypothetical protein ACRDRD_18650 [Pseudonocardiaceae bacterium]
MSTRIDGPTEAWRRKLLVMAPGLRRELFQHLSHAPISEYPKWNDDNAEWLAALDVPEEPPA